MTDTDHQDRGPAFGIGYAVVGVLVVIALGAVTRFLEAQVPQWADGTAFERVAKSIEFPVYAIALGLIGNVVLSRLALRDALSRGFRTEFFIKTGLVLLGASINLKVLVTAAGPAIIQALLLISIVFGFTWWLGGVLELDDKLRALLASAVSICGVSAAIAAAGAVQAKREQLAYAASLVIAFALPSIFLLPWLADVFGPFRCRRRRVDRRQHRHDRGGRRVRSDRRRGRASDRDHREDHSERAHRCRRDRADRVLRVEGGAEVRRTGDTAGARAVLGALSRSSCSASSLHR